MEIGEVIGNVWATKKDDAANGLKLLIVSLTMGFTHSQAGQPPKERLIVAADMIGAGVGDRVLVTQGSAARWAVGNERAPVDAAIIGIVDSLDIQRVTI